MNAAGTTLNARIHVVDDDADFRDALSWLFDSRGHTVAVWPGAEPFLQMAQASSGEWGHAVVLLDIRMAPVSGLTTFARLKDMACPWPVDATAEQQRLRLALVNLSPRELEVLDELILGHYNKIIAEHLGVTPRTIEFHRANIFEKLAVDSAIELAHKLGRYGLR